MDKKDIEGLKKHTAKQIEKIDLVQLQNEQFNNMSISEVKSVLVLLEEEELKIEKKLIMSSEDYITLGKLKERIVEFQKKLV